MRITATLDYLNPLLSMANCHMVTYLTHNLWKEYIPKEIQREIQSKDDLERATDIYWMHLRNTENDFSAADEFKYFRTFLAGSNQHCIDSLTDVWISPDQLKEKLRCKVDDALPIKGFMSTKKTHEVS